MHDEREWGVRVSTSEVYGNVVQELRHAESGLHLRACGTCERGGEVGMLRGAGDGDFLGTSPGQDRFGGIVERGDSLKGVLIEGTRGIIKEEVEKRGRFAWRMVVNRREMCWARGFQRGLKSQIRRILASKTAYMRTVEVDGLQINSLIGNGRGRIGHTGREIFLHPSCRISDCKRLDNAGDEYGSWWWLLSGKGRRICNISPPKVLGVPAEGPDRLNPSSFNPEHGQLQPADDEDRKMGGGCFVLVQGRL
ncbi:hypothetical protein BXZ70DRAFT_911047 [Cristinia sonorae]|uniref:Uncharacterized protein n=1 Tax=Cristinia sonorae TaxID=1940300 RepID=A0A8K0XK61_9AGAR|nr:hypothetical protein BXZ70DRAFT_911047 [Cristinia sonorae]